MRVSEFHLACPAPLLNSTSNRLTKRYRVLVVIRFDIDFDFGSYSLTVLHGQTLFTFTGRSITVLSTTQGALTLITITVTISISTIDIN